MAKNGAISNAITNNEALAGIDSAVRNRALDDLLKADPADLKSIRLAIIINKGFWEHFPGLKEADGHKFYEDNDNLLTLVGPPGVEVIRQMAAQQRVTLGLKDVDDDVLIGILTHNEEECRAYLASKPVLGKFGVENQVHGWKKNEPAAAAQPPAPVPPARNKSDNILTADAIREIRHHARDLLLLRLIAQSKDRNHIELLLTARDKASVDNAAKNLNYPQSANATLSYPLSEPIQNALQNRLQVLDHAAGKTEFQQYVADLSSNDILRQVENLKKNNNAFLESIPQPIKNKLTIEDMDWAKSVLGVSYLKVAVAQLEIDLLPLLKTNTEEEFKAKLKETFGQHDYIDLAVKDNLGVIKNAMLKQFIPRLDLQKLKALNEAVGLKQCQKVFVDAGVTPVDWIVDTNLKDIKQSARSFLFEDEIKKVPQLGVAPHPQLIRVFNELPVAKQQALLKKTPPLYQVLTALDVEQLAVHLGTGVAGLAELAEENKSLAVFQLIHNPAVARILSAFQPTIKLSAVQVDALNRDLDAATARNNGQDFNNPALYKGIIDNIKVHCGADVNAGRFYQAFGLSNDGSAFKEPSAIRDQIKAQNQHNQELLRAYALISPEDKSNKSLEKQLLGILLTLNKNAPIDPKEIVKQFNGSRTYNEFIERVVPRGNSDLQAQLYTQLSSSIFYQLKNAVLKNNLNDADPFVVIDAVTDLKKIATSINQHLGALNKSREHFKFIEGIKPHHLYNPSFRGEAQLSAKQMKGQYQQLSNDCDLIVEQLRRDQKAIEAILSQNENPGNMLSEELDKRILRVFQQLREELDAIKSNLQFYETIQQKLSGDDGILQALDEAADHKKSYMFHADYITRRIESRDHVEGLTYSSQKHKNGLETPSDTAGGRKLELGQSIPEGKIAVVDYVQTAYKQDKVSKDYEVVGRYTVDLSPPGTMTLKGDKVTRSSGGKFEIQEFPRQTLPVPAKGSAEDFRLIKAKMEFSLALAADAIANLDSPPTKEKPLRLYGDNEEQMRYLWTALIILGEKNPHMKINADAIKLDRFGENQFDPAQEKGSFLGISTGFHNNSLYQLFKNSLVKDSVEQTVDAVKQMSADKKSSEKERPKVDSQAAKATKSIKDGLSVFLRDARTTRNAEGPEEKRDTGLKNS
ncbi:interaptin [Legionella moravica]|uniref:Interaptin n=1 Tax=Legionella moravica TaxID=39962 RepID=A0A378JZW4_9GAMM|nr:hypothetical protein [Legionella moravica]KTD31009.1 interaptin [Legionella moravica]STX63587.1 interaptin [Legionella moravica]